MLTILRKKKLLKMFLIKSGLHKDYIYNIYLYIDKLKQERKEKLKQGKEKAFLRLNHDFELIESRCCCRTDCAFGHSGNFFSSHCEITLHCFLVEKAKNCTKPLVLNTTFVPIKNSHRFVSKM